MSEKNSQLDYYLAQANAKEAISSLKEYFLGNVGEDFLQTNDLNPLSRNTDRLKLDALTSLLDTTSGAYFIKDILSGEVELEGVEDYVKILYNEDGGILEYESTMGEITQQFIATYDNSRTKKKEDENGNLVNATTNDGELIFVPAANNTDEFQEDFLSNSGTPNRFNNPSLAAIEIKNVQYSIGNRNNDLNNLFFNAIPNLEMSRATPFIQFKLITAENPLFKNRLSSPFFFRFLKSEDGEYQLDDNAGLSKGKSFIESKGVSSTLSVSNIGKSFNTAGMELFTSPQTLVNANIRRGDDNLFNEDILDPFQPLMTLKSLKFDNTGLGGTLYTSKSATVELILHDRSRLKDIQPLISAREFGLNQVLIEFGWSHPDGGPESNNDFGRIINSLRDVGLYNVQQTNFSIGASGEVNISMTLRCTGTQEFKNISTAAGFYTPLSVLKPQIEQVVEEYINSKIQNASDKSLPEVRKRAKIIRNNAYSSGALIEYSLFSELMQLAGYTEGSDDEKINDDAFLNALRFLLVSYVDLEDTQNNSEAISQKYKETAVEAIMGKVYGITDFDLGERDPMLASVATGYNPINREDVNNSIVNLLGIGDFPSSKYASLGRIICSMVGTSFASAGRFDEVQVFFYPLNSKAGGARRFTTAGLPINKATFKEVMEKEIQKNPNMSISSFVGLIGREILNNDSYEVYGISNQIEAAEDLKEQFNEDIKVLRDKLRKELKSSDSDEEKKKIQEEFEFQRDLLVNTAERDNKDIESSVDATLSLIYKNDGGPPVEAVFKNPVLKYYIENLPVISPDTGQVQFGQKSICRIHIYDKESIVSPFAERLNDLITTHAQSREVKTETISQFDDSSSIEDFTDSQKIGDSVIYKLSQGVSARDIKQKIKEKIANVTLGTSNGVVKSVSVSAQPGGAVGNVLLLNSISDKTKSKTSQAQVDFKDDVDVIPGQVSLTCLGNPCIQHASQFYIDFNSGTTLDNIYIVKNVSHTIGPGDFTTTLTLSYTGQGTTSSIKKRIDDAIAANESN
jgi:hypothetical protein